MLPDELHLIATGIVSSAWATGATLEPSELAARAHEMHRRLDDP
ncbi:hypothetical protein [Conexibacter sp. W3-3-2]|nr:hypothetical protein [Conexibacter sp. W3-3-2]